MQLAGKDFPLISKPNPFVDLTYFPVITERYYVNEIELPEGCSPLFLIKVVLISMGA